MISSEVPCEDVRACLSAGDGIDFDQATGVISADLSEQAGNKLSIADDGGLFVPTGAATVSVGCGLTGDGSGSAPVTVNTGTWPYPCAPEDSGGIVACDANGVLRSEPRGQLNYFQLSETRNYNNVRVPTANSATAATFSLSITNPDTCRRAVVLVEREVDVDFNLPAGAGAAYGHDGDQMYYMRNTGSSAMNDVHTQTTKLYRYSAALTPGAAATINLPINIERGSGNATYNRIQVLLRAILISL
ncbi:hypothetical protein [Streptomyces sp. NPDC050287]|uniref:hypothetical protein n=1 Tax=Streptomyces sp. NPDC050287 TaxID=3365608 RepID=UPI0037983690